MSQLIRLVYASRSTFTPRPNQQGLDPGVARILAKSRKNNAQLQVVGGLLFGEGYFLQCLEGDADVVQALYDKIAADPRHRDVTVLSEATISSRSFGAWSMKYVPGEQRLQALLQQWGLARFDPYHLSMEQIEAVARFMKAEVDGPVSVPGERHEPAPMQPRAMKQPAVASLPTAKAARQSPNHPQPVATAERRTPWIVALGALGTMCVAGIGYLLFR